MDTTTEQERRGGRLFAPATSRPTLSTRGICQFWERKRLILSMLAGSLIVIAAIVQLLFLYQQETADENTRRLGQTLTRLIADIPYDSLDENRIANLFKNTYESQVGASLAYISLVNGSGEPVYEIAAPGIHIPDAVINPTPANWYSERSVSLSDKRQAEEFSAPWLVATHLHGFIRLAYSTPANRFGWQETWLAVLIAFFSILQALLLYAFVLREIGKHRRTPGGSIAAMGTGKNLSVLLGSLNDQISSAKLRIAELEDEQAGLVTGSSIATYQYKKAEAILHTIPDGILMLDDAGTIKFANKKIASMFNTDRQQIQEEPLHTWCAEESFRQYIRRIFSSDSAANSEAEFTMVVGGDEKRFMASSHPIFLTDGDHGRMGVLVLVADHTQQSVDTKNREELVAHICHEIKTPLNTLSMCSESLLADDVTEEFRLDAINIIYDETHRMKDLINNLLNLTRIEMGSISINRQRVKLHDFLLDIFSNITCGAEDSGLEFKLDIPNGLEDVPLDKTLFRIVITNLMTNAIKYNRPKGAVILKAEETDDHVIISVSDTGIGISEADRKSIFEKFFRSTEDNVRQISGHGLGLALARDIVQMHNGTLKVNSEPGKGSEFVVSIMKDPELLMKVG